MAATKPQNRPRMEHAKASYNIADAKAHLSEIIERVESGEEVRLTRRGKPVARVLPIERSVDILGAGRHDANINHDAVARDEWWKPMNEEETAEWYG